MQIELSYAIALTSIILFGILSYAKKMSIGIGISAILGGFGIAWYFATYTEIIMRPLGDALMYGYSLSWVEYIAIIHLFSVIFVVCIAGYNLFKSGGKIAWA